MVKKRQVLKHLSNRDKNKLHNIERKFQRIAISHFMSFSKKVEKFTSLTITVNISYHIIDFS